jgi:hypothetical protein
MWSFTGEERWELLEGASIAGSRGGYQSGGARTAMAGQKSEKEKKRENQQERSTEMGIRHDDEQHTGTTATSALSSDDDGDDRHERPPRRRRVRMATTPNLAKTRSQRNTRRGTGLSPEGRTRRSSSAAHESIRNVLVRTLPMLLQY